MVIFNELSYWLLTGGLPCIISWHIDIAHALYYERARESDRCVLRWAFKLSVFMDLTD